LYENARGKIRKEDKIRVKNTKDVGGKGFCWQKWETPQTCIACGASVPIRSERNLGRAKE